MLNIELVHEELLEQECTKDIPESLQQAGFLTAQKNSAICFLRYQFGALEDRFDCLEEQKEYYYAQASIYQSSILN